MGPTCLAGAGGCGEWEPKKKLLKFYLKIMIISQSVQSLKFILLKSNKT